MLRRLALTLLMITLLFMMAACGGDDDDRSLKETEAPTAVIGSMVAPTQDEAAIIQTEDAVIQITGDIQHNISQEQLSFTADLVEGDADYYVLTAVAMEETDHPVFSIILTLQSTLEPTTYPVIYCGEDQVPPPDVICAVTIGTEGSIYTEITSGEFALESVNPISGTLALVANKVSTPVEGEATAEVTAPLPLGTVAINLEVEDVPVTER